MYCIALYCIILYCNLMHCIVFYCIVLYCILLYRIVLYFIVSYCIVFYCIVLYCIVLYFIVLYCIVLYCIVLYCIVLYTRLTSREHSSAVTARGYKQSSYEDSNVHISILCSQLPPRSPCNVTTQILLPLSIFATFQRLLKLVCACGTMVGVFVVKRKSHGSIPFERHKYLAKKLNKLLTVLSNKFKCSGVCGGVSKRQKWWW